MAGKKRRGKNVAFKRDWACSKCKFTLKDVPTSVQKQSCPKCGEEMTKVISAPLIMFKGDGWTERFYKQEE